MLSCAQDPVATARGSDTTLMDAPGCATLIFNCTLLTKTEMPQPTHLLAKSLSTHGDGLQGLRVLWEGFDRQLK